MKEIDGNKKLEVAECYVLGLSYKDMWRKVGIELVIDVKESGAATALKRDGNYDVGRGGGNIISLFYTPPTLTTTIRSYGDVQDPILNEAFADIRRTIVTDGLKAGMRKAREISKYVIDQIYGIPTPSAPDHVFWWPWVRNYSGELSIGYFDRTSGAPWVWIDQDLKKAMGH